MLNINDNLHDEFIVVNLNHGSNNLNSNEDNNITLENYNINNNIINQQPTTINNNNQSNNTLPKTNKKSGIGYGFVNLMKLCFDI